MLIYKDLQFSFIPESDYYRIQLRIIPNLFYCQIQSLLGQVPRQPRPSA